MFYKDPTTGEVRNLTEKELKYFDGMISAIGNRRIDLAQKALSKLAFLPHSYNERGGSLLNFAITEPNEAGIEIARLLVAHGADIYHRDNEGITIFGMLVGMLNRGQISREIHDGFCRALDLRDSDGNPTTDTLAIMRTLIHEESVREVEEEWAAKKAAEEESEIRQAAEEANAKELAYLNADFAGKMRIDPDRAFQEYQNDPRVKESMKISAMIREGIQVKTVLIEAETENKEAQDAIQSLYNKPEKSSQLEFPVSDGLSSILENMFSSKSLDNLIGTKESYALEAGNRGFFKSFGDWVNYLSDNLSYLLNMEIDGSLVEATILQLQGLLTMAGSGNLPIGFPHRYNPDDDFGDFDGFGGSNSGVALIGNNPMLPQNFQVVTILPNNTLVIAAMPADTQD